MVAKKSLDISKFIMSLFIIGIHTDLFNDLNSQLSFFTGAILFRIAVPFFFMISGYLFSNKMNKSTELTKSEYYYQYIKKIAILYAFWSLIYIFWDLPMMIEIEGYNVPRAILKYLWFLVFYGSHFHLWYIPALIFSITILYVAMRYKCFYTLFSCFLLLYVFGLTGDTYFGLIPSSILEKFWNRYFSLFWSTTNGLFFGSIFVLLGGSIGEDNNKEYDGPLAILFFLMLVCEVYSLRYLGLLRDFNKYISLIPFSFFFFRFILNHDINISDFAASKMRELSIHIYFIHGIYLILIPQLLKQLDIEVASVFYFFLVAVASISSAYLVCYLLSIQKIRRHEN